MAYQFNKESLFWKECFQIWNIDLPITDKQKSSQTFRIITPYFNAQDYLRIYLYSLEIQLNNNFKSYLIDDCSTDNSTEIVKQVINCDSRFSLTVNSDKRYALENIVRTIDSIDDIDDEDIIILLDGDDWLSSDRVLSHLEFIYRQNDCLMTYGSYAFFPIKRKGIEPSAYSKQVIENNLYRKDTWRASHLRTFKYKLWKKLNYEDLKINGGYLKYAYDQAIMLPLLEMSREKALYIPEVLHVYNRTNPLNVDKIKRREQEQCANYIRNKQPYERAFT